MDSKKLKQEETMLQLKNINKYYSSGDNKVQALKNISISFRKNEFVSILGQSGGGKTTMLNIIGGLDHYSDGDLIISGKSTKDFKDKDWDSYRNHSVGFVFQAYNLIPHQTILSNVELALTLSGVGKAERKNRALEALKAVGLSEHVKKRPNQLSGGQMQRVAIARALVNDPEILLADEPTGALDTETSVQVMDILKEVAKYRLVIMVTHNPELAEEYSNRIVRIKDGSIIDDTNPFDGEDEEEDTSKQQRTSMNFLTALSLSKNNLMTKKGRTLLTAFAGSIGIIGIALILSLSDGVNTYIEDVQRDTMTSYPITIDAEAMDLTSIMAKGRRPDDYVADHEMDGVYSNGTSLERASSFTTSFSENNLTAFKKYLDDENSEINQYIGNHGVVYSYDTDFHVYAYDIDGKVVSTDGKTIGSDATDSSSSSMMMPGMSMGPMTSMMGSTDNFQQLIPGTGDELVSSVVTENYDLVYGNWPAAYDEVVLVMDENNEISSKVLYELGLLPSSEYKEINDKINKGEEIELEDHNWTYEDITSQTFYMVPACDFYLKNDNGLFDYIGDDKGKVEELAEKGTQLKIKGIIRKGEDVDTSFVSGSVGYTKALTDYVINYTDDSEVVKAQKENPDTNIINGLSFSPADDSEKIKDAKEYLLNLKVSDKASMFGEILRSSGASSMAANMGEEQLAASLDQYLKGNPDDAVLLAIYEGYMSSGSYDDNMKKFGVVSLDAPTSIDIYTDSFEAKDGISKSIENYNNNASEDDKITYTDYVGLLMSSITTIVNSISYVLIAFVGISLVVSSIMIGIITYISVLERKKEIGILRAIGASKKDVSRVFNAETFIIGLCSGVMGIAITWLLCFPINSIIHAVTGNTGINAALPPVGAVVLVIISVGLTLIAGLFPAGIASRKDPVEALRSE